ncbi:hypothetical protein GCM10010398_58900 [Streptomyces fimbriatus]
MPDERGVLTVLRHDHSLHRSDGSARRRPVSLPGTALCAALSTRRARSDTDRDARGTDRSPPHPGGHLGTHKKSAETGHD